jgi:hypothetical protein
MMYQSPTLPAILILIPKMKVSKNYYLFLFNFSKNEIFILGIEVNITIKVGH